jgi:hypothetical protein
MANARTRYETLASYLVRNREAKEGTLYGKSCLTYDGEPFLTWHRDAVAFRLHGRALNNALSLKGCTPFDPLHPDRPPPGRPGWVRVPPSQFIAWDRLAMDAMRCVKVAQNQHVSWQPPPPPPEPPPAPPRSTPDSLAARVAAALKGGFLSRFTLSRGSES